MKTKITKTLLFIIISSFFSVSYAGLFTIGSGNDRVIYCDGSGVTCDIDNGVNIVKDNVNDIEKNKKFSSFSQDIVVYILGFVALIGVIYIIYAGFNILNSNGDESKVKKSKSMIAYVVLGLLVMFIAYPIIKFTLNMVNSNGTGFELPSIVDKAYAYTINDNNTFDEYKKKIELLATDLERDYKVNGKISTSNLDTLKDYVTKASDTFSNDDNFITNNSLSQDLLISIEVVRKSPDSENKITEMATALSNFLTKVKLKRITATVKASPQSGNAPLTTTLRTENVIDPSGVVIPQSSYIWRIKQSDGSNKTLGTGPSIPYTFKEEKNYIINLDIASSSRNDKGKTDVLPFWGKVQINVLPSLGDVYLYINGVNVNSLDKLKITPNIGKAGLIIDASASQPIGGSKFIKTTWDFGNGNTSSYDYAPKIEKQYYVTEGTYKLSLKILTNESKEITKDLYIDVRDPVASIKADKNSGFVGDDFKFGVNTAFYDGKLSHEWKITEIGSDQSIFSSSKENFTYKFKKTGKFAIKLKSLSPSGIEDTDLVVVNIESRDPIATFDSSVASGETPNTYKFDATTSFDPDTFDSSKLQFNWTVDGEKIDLENSLRNGAIGKYTFNTEGTHKVVLDVSNQDNKTASMKKNIVIGSLLSVKLNFSPKIVKMNTTLSIIAESKNASIFEWNFGDSTSDITDNGRTTHVYKKAGKYDLTVNVRGVKNGDSNSITRKVFVSNGDSPVASMTLVRDGEEIFMSPNVCDGQDAYVLDRSSIINFSGESSVNIDGSNSGLGYSWKYIDKISSKSKFSYKFNELGCFPITLTVKSLKNGTLDTLKYLVKVDNLPPRVAGLTINAPDINSDPVIVQVSANNALDIDGIVVSYLWYYYTDSDSELQDYRITRLPETTFVLPKVTGKYYFVLIIEDSNGAKINTEDLTEERYSVQLITDNMNTPLIKLGADKTSIATGDEINFNVVVTDILGKDISDKVEYKYDYDGDGFYDETSKSGKVTHKFAKSGNINFKVKVTYKGISNTKYQLISVKNTLKPNFEYYAIGKKIVLFNTSAGSYSNTTWDLGNNVKSTNLNSFTYDFGDEEFPSSVTLTVGDGTDSQSITLPVRKDVLNERELGKTKEKLIVFTYPKLEDGTVHLSKDDTKAFIYLGESKGEISDYCIDSDTTVDIDLNGTPDDDCDNKGIDSYSSGVPFTITDFDSNFKERNIKVSIFNGKDQIESKKFKIVLDYLEDKKALDVEVKDNKNISENDRLGIETLKDLIKKAQEKDRLKMMQFLSSLQENWFDDREKTKVVIDFESYVSVSEADQGLKDQFFNTLEGFLMDQSQVKDEIALAAKVLKSLIPETNPNYTQIEKNIDEILSHPTNTTLNKDLGKFILESIKDDTNISNKDKVIIKSQLQVVIYGSQKNIPEDVKTATTNEATGATSGILPFIFGVIKWFFYVLLGFVLIFIALFIFFKVSNKNDNLSFQDFLIELFMKSGNGEESSINKTKAPVQPASMIKKSEPKIETSSIINDTNQVLDNTKIQEIKSQENVINEMPKFIAENPISEANNNPASDIPDWLKANKSNISSQESIIPTSTAQESKSDDNGGLPDWLKGSQNIETSQSINKAEETTEKDTNIFASEDIPEHKDINNVEVLNADNPNSNLIQNTVADSKEPELPNWLKGLDQNELNQEINSELNQGIVNDTIIADESSNVIKDHIVSKETINQENDLPDWLKGSTNSSVSSESISNEETTEVISDSNEPSVNKEEKAEEVLNPIFKETSDIKEDKTKIERKKQSKKHPKEESDENDSVINAPKTITKKPKIIGEKKEDKILNQNTDDLPDWLK